MEITFDEAVNGTTKQMTYVAQADCDSCKCVDFHPPKNMPSLFLTFPFLFIHSGTGAQKGSKSVTKCPQCNGRGVVRILPPLFSLSSFSRSFFFFLLPPQLSGNNDCPRFHAVSKRLPKMWRRGHHHQGPLFGVFVFCFVFCH